MEREGKSTERITVARDRHRERDGGGGEICPWSTYFTREERELEGM